MKKTILVLIILSTIMCFTGCSNNTLFSGNRTGNENQFLVDADILNTTVESNMDLVSGDVIDTEIDVKKGEIDILVKNENNTTVYKGDDVEDLTFKLEIEEPGTYTFQVTGRKAKGSVHFVKETEAKSN